MNERLTKLPLGIDCSAVSQLQIAAADDASPLSDETLLLVSQPTYQSDQRHETTTGYFSRKVTLNDFTQYISDQLKIYDLSAELEKKVNIDDVIPEGGVLSCEVENPYVISSFHYSTVAGSATLTGVQGYRLLPQISNEICVGVSGVVSAVLSNCVKRDDFSNVLEETLSTKVPAQLKYKISYDDKIDSIVLSNEAAPEITSAIDIRPILEDALSDMLQVSQLSNVTYSQKSQKLYLHFVVEVPGEEKKLKKIAIDVGELAELYEFDETQFSISCSPDDGNGHISVSIDPVISSFNDAISTLSDYVDGNFETTTSAEYRYNVLVRKVNSEATAARAAEKANADAIAAEIQRATGKEAALERKIDESTSKYDSLSTKIDDEAEARQAADVAIEKSAALSTIALSNEIYSYVNGGKEALSRDNKIATLNDINDLSGTIHFRGIDNSFLSGDGTTIPNTPWYADGNLPHEGDLIVNASYAKEFLFTGKHSASDPSSGKWNELGDESLYATKAELSTEIDRAIAAEELLHNAIEAESAAATAAENYLSNAISTEIDRAIAAEEELSLLLENDFQFLSSEISGVSVKTNELEQRVTIIENKIPPQALSTNQLADKDFVNSSIQTNTAYYRGNFLDAAAIPASSADYEADPSGSTAPSRNDYMFVQDSAGMHKTDGAEISGCWRFKYISEWPLSGKAGWIPEYSVNDTAFTANQWKAVNSNVTDEWRKTVNQALNPYGNESTEPNIYKVVFTTTDQHVAGKKTVDDIVLANKTYLSSYPTNDHDIAHKLYVDDVISAEATRAAIAELSLHNEIAAEVEARQQAFSQLGDLAGKDLTSIVGDNLAVVGAKLSARDTLYTADDFKDSFLSTNALEGYATQQWVNDQHFVSSATISNLTALPAQVKALSDKITELEAIIQQLSAISST